MALLGSTGSIGVNTLKIASRFGIAIEALSAGDNIALLNKQIAYFHPKYVAIKNKHDKPKIKHDKVFYGNEGILEMLELCKSETIVNALVGYAGLAPTVRSQELGKKIALANKESLVVAGSLIDTTHITPIDSEHFGLWYLQNKRTFNKLYITASGGALRDWEINTMAKATFKEALNHPNWSMGNKITIDSATMTNKLFELLEAKWLFDTDKIDALIEKRSIIHALIEFKDGSTTAHLADVDMQLPIAFALNQKLDEAILPPINLAKLGAIEFQEIRSDRYPIWQIKDHLLTHPHLGVIINAANEEAILKFKNEQCSFFGMSDIVLDAYKKFDSFQVATLDEIIAVDKEVRAYVNT
ncbi:MAG: 1-deoxy-D-xylulose-5-phosphate reductoisomerase [Campylobacterales bacterium]|nr:1-deoxy-D-xylulose-5-phosphate reductoisomerase [Campylobacterales bacterium]